MSGLIKGLAEPIGIVGMGLSGTAILNLLRFVAPEKKYITFDAKAAGADFQDLEELLKTGAVKTLVISPGVPLRQPAILQALVNGVFITSELTLAFSLLKSEKVIAITGSVGKSTTTALIAEAAKSRDPNALAVGNIGKPLAEYVLEVLESKRKRAGFLALELSSFQLENFANLSVPYSVITYLTPNHLERYENLLEYYETKWLVTERTKKKAFLNAESADLLFFAKRKFPGPHVRFCSPTDDDLQEYDLSSAQLLGSHNQQNLALAADLIQELGWGQPALDAIKKFPGLPHRLENLGRLKGVRFVNDSKATALDSVFGAAHAVATEVQAPQSLYILIGGKDKNLPWHNLSQLGKMNILKPLYFGECAEKAKAGLQKDGPTFKTLADALSQSFSLLKEGDTLLLSPGGTSHDEFANFEQRGEFFRQRVLAQFS